MLPVDTVLPSWWQNLCYIATVLAILISANSICRQFLNYRRPSEQRLNIRIQLLVPIFSLTCLIATLRPILAQLLLDPIREIYEAFVIYTFFSLLILILGGERRIITEICINDNHPPIRHPIPILGHFFPTIDLSDPSDFLLVKRGILQYVWFKPLYCICVILSEALSMKKSQFGLLIIYNVSVTLSLYSLALFWRCLYQELKPHNPWSKFLCVKLIIFASYWQNMIIQTIAILGKLENDSIAPYLYQNGLLCIEMVGFAIFHSVAFPWQVYSSKTLPMAARMNTLYALRDCFGGGDLKWDFKQTLLAGPTYYNFKNFDSTAESRLVARTNMTSRMHRINEGVRFTNNGEDRYWMHYGAIGVPANSNCNNSNVDRQVAHQNESVNTNIGSTIFNEEIDDWDDTVAGQGYITDDPNYPVTWDPNGYKYGNNISRIRADIRHCSANV
ncbi:Hfl1p NDAI_0B05370 [Naumovozyma dairenensis CBS 421]|uniref:Organic solute transporter Ostalpha n=1 Tax=Naumovozyma dairenensis (strain ATCC 10597 / BCRC 20456 / CBS 421 / NBRC 0211 / NRRL Y-12639) TaxID=1071378 RepID=G0W709_NAUDC|nr:hypothetical protein NDAI_0B05370 [Naumovozyma dairenensis CBS 421]CCD23570.1 hypothetical protein NDAI_0B05370 [Naumovozyma dairenensis CBS 421]